MACRDGVKAARPKCIGGCTVWKRSERDGEEEEEEDVLVARARPGAILKKRAELINVESREAERKLGRS